MIIENKINDIIHYKIRVNKKFVTGFFCQVISVHLFFKAV